MANALLPSARPARTTEAGAHLLRHRILPIGNGPATAVDDSVTALFDPLGVPK